MAQQQPSANDEAAFGNYIKDMSRNEVKAFKRLPDKEQLLLVYSPRENWLCEPAQNEEYGMHMVAIKDIEQGDWIMADRPLVFYNLHPQQCVECETVLLGNNNQGIPCSGHKDCRHRYCSTNCEAWAWEHYHCVQDPENLGHILDLTMKRVVTARTGVLMLSKIIAMYEVGDKNQKTIDFIEERLAAKERDGQKAAMTSADGSVKSSTFKGILTQEQMEEWVSEAFHVGIKNNLSTPLGKDVIKIAKILELMLQDNFGDMFKAAFMGPTSYFNHSCIPNAEACFGDSITYATRPIAKGEQIFINYVAVGTLPKAKRQESIKRQYGFICNCPDCTRFSLADHCDNCDKTAADTEDKAPLRTCTRCKGAKYCSRACQREHWKVHKANYCDRMAKLWKDHNAKYGLK